MKKTLTTVALAAALLTPTLAACSGDSKDVGKSASPSNSASQSNSSSPSASDGEKKDAAVDANAFALPVSDKYKLDDGGKLASISGDQVFAAQGSYAFVGKDVVVMNEGNNGYRSNVYRALKLSNGADAWRLDFSNPQGVQGLNNVHLQQLEQVGNSIIAIWSGQLGGDALNEAKTVNYLQQFSLDTGKKIDEVKVEGDARYGKAGLGRYLAPADLTENATAKIFYPSGTAVESTSEGMMVLERKVQREMASGSTAVGSFMGSPWIQRTAPGKGYVRYSNSDGKAFYRAIDTKTGKFLGAPVAAGGGVGIEGTSPMGAYTAIGGVVINAADPTKMMNVQDIAKTELRNVSLDDKGNFLATASATGDPTWVYVNSATKQAKILDAVGDSNSSAVISNGYVVKSNTVNASDSQGKQLWTGNVMVNKAKGVAAE